MIAFWICFSISLLTLIYGIVHDDARIIIGVAMLTICIASIIPENNNFICEGVDGVVEAHRTHNKRWVLSNGDSYHSIDFHKKCKRVSLPTN